MARPNKGIRSLCFITHRDGSPLTCLEMTLFALRAGIRWVQYREKSKSRLELYREATKLRQLTREFSATLIINDYADIAAAVGADGVHLGQDDLPVKHARKLLGEGRIIGVSTHSLDEAIRAEAEGADYIGFGPIFKTTTKEAGPPKGVELLGRVKASVRIPVVAIGGITLGNLDLVLESGADAVAVATAILRGNIERNTKEFLKKTSKNTVLKCKI